MEGKENMKKMLFVMPTISCGGAEKALVELLKNINYSEYQVDLLLFRKDDMHYLNEIPSKVNILDHDIKFQYAFYHVKHLIKPKMFLRNIPVVVFRCWQTAMLKIRKILRIKSYYYNWKTLKYIVPKNKKTYDIAIGYLEGNSIYYVVDKVDAQKKYGFFHTNFIKGGFKKSYEEKYVKELDKLFAVSKTMEDDLKKNMPEMTEKIDTITNLINVEELYQKAKEEHEINNNFKEYKGKKIISIGNLRYVKGYDISIKVCKKIKKDGYSFKWYILGEGKERKNLEKLIRKNHIENEMILMGSIKNPYIYLNNSDIYVQTSRHEGLSTTVREAKIFCKPIVITDCQGMSDQIKNGKTGTITSYEVNDIAKAIEELLDNKNETYINNLKIEKEKHSIGNQMEEFYKKIG